MPWTSVWPPILHTRSGHIWIYQLTYALHVDGIYYSCAHLYGTHVCVLGLVLSNSRGSLVSGKDAFNCVLSPPTEVKKINGCLRDLNCICLVCRKGKEICWSTMSLGIFWGKCSPLPKFMRGCLPLIPTPRPEGRPLVAKALVWKLYGSLKARSSQCKGQSVAIF